jgi:endonuclease-3
MASSTRSTKISKIHKVLKKAAYEPLAPHPQRTVLEQLLFAACLENAKFDDAEQAFAALGHNFFDWNEVRVTTVRELSEEMSCLPAPSEAAQRVKKTLQSVFEAKYSFDLEELRKENLGPATEHLRKTKGSSPFTVSYVVQAALGGHSVPIDAAAMKVMQILDLVKEKDATDGTVPGLERAIPKNKGIEFGTMLHQFAVEFVATPHKPELRKLLLEIDPDAASRLPKRRSKQAKAEPKKEVAPKKKTAKKTKIEKTRSKKSAATPAKKTAKSKGKKPPRKAKPAKKPTPKKKSVKSKTAGASTKPSKRTRSTSKGLSKKKPR